MIYNKITLDGEVLMDLSEDTVAPENLLIGETAHDASGRQIYGTYDPKDQLLNSRYDDGAVEKGDGQKNKFWRTDENGNPQWADSDAVEVMEDHDQNESAHWYIRNQIRQLADRLNILADSDDETLDQMSEVVSYIKNNKDLIDGITTSKVNVSDIVNDLNSDATDKPLAAAQGKELKVYGNDIVKAIDMTYGSGDNGLNTPYEFFNFIANRKVDIGWSCLFRFKNVNHTWVPTGNSWNYAIVSMQSKNISTGHLSMILFCEATSNIYHGVITTGGTEETTTVTWNTIPALNNFPWALSQNNDNYAFATGITSKNVIGAINEVFQSASENKTKLANALTGAGVTLTGNENWDELIGKVDDSLNSGLHRDCVVAGIINAATVELTFPALPENIYVSQTYKSGSGYALVNFWRYNRTTGKTYYKYEDNKTDWLLYTGNPFTINGNTVTFNNPSGSTRLIMFG